MSVYATEARLQTYVDGPTIALLTDDDKDGAKDQAVVDGLLFAASVRVDSALRAAGYELPLATVTDELVDLAARLVVGPLYARRPMVEMPAAVELVYKAAESDLKAVAAGNLVVVAPAETLTSGGIAVSSDDDRGWADSELF